MQEKKNNALEKTEQIAESNRIENQSKHTERSNSGKGSTAKKVTSKAKKTARTKAVKDKKHALAEKQRREEERAELRMKKAEAKAEAKAERKRLAKEKKLAAEKKRQDIRELKIKKREERLARRDMFKHESKEQRAERKAAEKQARVELERERRARRMEAISERRRLKAETKAENTRRKAEAKAENARRKAEAKERRAKERSQRRAMNSSKSVGGWLAAVISLGCSCLVLATLLVWNTFMIGNGSQMLGGAYSKAFYDLVGYVDNIDVNLSKFGVSSDNGSKQKILGDIVVQANLAEDDMLVLPLKDESRFYTVKFVNQLSDFGRYLTNKLIDGEEITKSDLSTMAELKKINATLKTELNDLAESLGDGYDFTVLLNGEEDNIILKKFNELQSNAVEYPKMIYDGPFADEPEKSAKDIKKAQNPIDENIAKDKLTEYLSDYELTDIQILGKANGEYYSAYRLEAKSQDSLVEAQITDEGKLVTFNCFKDCNDKNFDRDQCIEIATKFLNKCGYKSIKPVWTTESGSTTYINFVTRLKDDIIVYADMIKVEVCMERGKVTAMDGAKYIENHKDRELSEPTLTVIQAEKKLSKDITVKTSRLAIIPLENGKERLAYEFFGNAPDGEYYIYIDAESGRELQIFKVVDGGSGSLLF